MHSRHLSRAHTLVGAAVLVSALCAVSTAQADHGLYAGASICFAGGGHLDCASDTRRSAYGEAGAGVDDGLNAASVIQGYGVFHGTASAQWHDEYLSPGGSVSMGATATGTATDTWTITGGTGLAYLHLTYTIEGDTASTGSGLGYQSAAYLTGTVNSTTQIARFGTVRGELSTGLVKGYKVIELSGSMPFEFGQPIDMIFSTGVVASTGYTAAYSEPSFTGSATASFGNTAWISAIQAYDASGALIPGITISAESGVDYLSIAAVPELPAGLMMPAGLAALAVALGRRRRRPSV